MCTAPELVDGSPLPAVKSKLVNLLWDIAEAKGSNGKANVALATLSSPTDGILLAGDKM